MHLWNHHKIVRLCTTKTHTTKSKQAGAIKKHPAKKTLKFPYGIPEEYKKYNQQTISKIL